MSGVFIILYVPTSSDNFLSSRKWLTVDLEHKRLYCFPCLLFAKKRKGPWVDSGFIKLSYLSGALEKHEGQEHRDAIIEQKLFLKRTSHLEVGSLIFMNTAEIERHNATVCQNREIIKRIINAVIFLAKEEMAFRGHDERHISEELLRFENSLIRVYIPVNSCNQIPP